MRGRYVEYNSELFIYNKKHSSQANWKFDVHYTLSLQENLQIIVRNLFHHNSQVNDNRESNYDDLAIVLNSLSRLFNLILTVVLCEYLFYRSRMRDLESLSNYFTQPIRIRA